MIKSLKVLGFAVVVSSLLMGVPSQSFAQKNYKLVTKTASQQDKVLDLKTVQQKWAQIKYHKSLSEKEKIKALDLLISAIKKLRAEKEKDVDLRIWHGTVLSTKASLVGGLSALDDIERAKELLEESLVLNDKAMDGFANAILGSIYYKVPGWPIAFGDDEQALEYFKKAVLLDPYGMDSNFYYGEYLYEEGDYVEALVYFKKALDAPKREDFPIWEEGRRQEIRSFIKQIEEQDKPLKIKPAKSLGYN